MSLCFVGTLVVRLWPQNWTMMLKDPFRLRFLADFLHFSFIYFSDFAIFTSISAVISAEEDSCWVSFLYTSRFLQFQFLLLQTFDFQVLFIFEHPYFWILSFMIQSTFFDFNRVSLLCIFRYRFLFFFSFFFFTSFIWFSLFS